jgi:hypothetical protein
LLGRCGNSGTTVPQTPSLSFTLLEPAIIGKYLSSLRKLDHIIAPKEGFEAQL